MRNYNQDRISSLPDSILHHILSFLPTLHAVQTCLLSKRWKVVRCSLPFLDFDYKTFLPPDESTENEEWSIDFVTFVDSVLLSRDSTDLQTLRLRWDTITTTADMTRINLWLMFALKHNVQVLDLDLDRKFEFTSDVVIFELPPCLFTCGTLRVLKLNLNFNGIRLPNLIYLSSLRILHLIYMYMSVGELSHALTCCPILETLIIVYSCSGYGPLSISTPLLKTLVIKGYVDHVVKISTPSLVSLELDLTSEDGSSIHFLQTLSSLVDVNINLQARDSELLVHFMRAFHNAHSLTLSSSFLKSVADKLHLEAAIFRCIKTQFHNLKLLEIGSTFCNGEVLVINTLLQLSPHLETISMKYNKEEESMSLKEDFQEEKVWFIFKLFNLKFVKMQNFEGSTNEVKFVKFFVDNAVKLEKFIFEVSKSGGEQVLAAVTKMLSTSPRVGNIHVNANNNRYASVFCKFI